MTQIFSDEIMEAAGKLEGNWIKAVEFEGDGLTLQIISVEKVQSKYGALESDYIVKSEILDVGETFRYTFHDKEGMERKIDSKSMPMFIGFKNVEGLQLNDWVNIIRTGKGEETRFLVEKIEM